jgi:hypothetical protein
MGQIEPPRRSELVVERKEPLIEDYPGLSVEMFPQMTAKEILIKAETHRPTVDSRGRVIWVSRNTSLYLGKDAPDIGPAGLSHAQEVIDIVTEIEKDYKAKLITRGGLNARTLSLRLALATVWAYHKKTRYGRKDRITPETAPILEWEHAKHALNAINRLRMKYKLKKVTYKAFRELVSKLKYRRKHPTEAQLMARQALREG